jgi:MFS family permease
MIGYASYLPMLMNTQTLFHGIYGVSTDRASQLFGICNLIEICLLPFVGYFVDATGKRALYLIAAFAILVLTTLCMLLGVPSPQHCLATLTYAQKKHCIEGAMFPTALIGLFQALFEGSIWICTQLVVAPAHIGLSQGVICSLYNLGMAVVPMLIGYFLDSSSLEIGYKLVLYTQLLLAFLSLILSFEVHFQDKNSTHHRVLYEIENCAVLESANYKLLVPPESSMAAGDEKAE